MNKIDIHNGSGVSKTVAETKDNIIQYRIFIINKILTCYR